MTKVHLIDCLAGFMVAAAFLIAFPFFWYRGAWGLLGYDELQAAFPGFLNHPNAIALAMAVLYFLLGFPAFLAYSRFPLYTRRHAGGARSLLLAAASFLVGVFLGYSAVLFFAAFAVLQWSPAL